MSSYYDDTDPMAELEALENERREADLEQAEMEAAGDEYWAQVKRYEQTGDPEDCPHGSGLGYRNPPAYPEQKLLKPGEFWCRRCKTVMPDPFADLD